MGLWKWACPAWHVLYLTQPAAAGLPDTAHATPAVDHCWSLLPPLRFELVLRNIQASSAGSAAEAEAAVAAAADVLRRNGFVNYFGLQRFGSGAVPTHR